MSKHNRNKLQNNSSWFNLTRNFVYSKPRQASAWILTITVTGGLIWFGAGNLKDKFFPTKNAQNTVVTQTIPGWWYTDYFGINLCESDICAPDSDPDEDKLTNLQEFNYHSDPLEAHTVGDEMNDGQLVAAGFDPSREGRMTFDQVLSEDNFLGEGLAYEEEIQQIIAEEQDISKIKIPLLDDSKLNIIYVEDYESVQRYVDEVKEVTAKYFTKDDMASVTDMLENGSDVMVQDFAAKASSLSRELEMIQVPAKLSTFHKYNISFYQLLSEILYVPPVDLLVQVNNVNADIWYEKAQAFIAVQQKLSFEHQLLMREFGE